MKQLRKVLPVLLSSIFLFTGNNIYAQSLAVNSDGTVADASAILDVKATGKGVLVPRMLSSERPISPVTGLLIYQTDAPAGFYYYDGAAWVFIQSSSNVTTQGNIFNGANQLVQLTPAGLLPAVDGSLLTNISASPAGAAGGDLTGTYPNPTVAATAATGNNLITSVNTASSGIINASRLQTTVTTRGNIFNGASQLLQMTAASKLPAVDGSLLTGLNASNISSGTVGTARLATGTADNTTFLRGDGTWNAPSASGASQTFTFSLVTPANTSQNYTGLNGTAFIITNPAYKATIMAVAGTIDKLYISGTISQNPASNTVVVTLYKNGVLTAITASVTVSTTGTTVTANDVAHSVSFNAGDQIAIGLIQTNSGPFTQMSISTHTQ